MKRKSAHRRSKKNPLGALLLLIFTAAVAILGFKLYLELGNLGSVRFGRLNIITKSNDVVLFSLNSIEKRLSIIKIPNDLFAAELVHGYGQYRAGSIYDVGQIDSRGGQTLAMTMKEILGVPVDGYYVTSGVFPSDVKRFFLTPDFLFGKNSNLAMPARLQLLTTIISLRFDKIKIIDLKEFSSQLILADGSSALGMDSAEIDRALSGIFNESQLQDENYRVEVVNTTKTVGLGARAVRLLTNLGLNVINIENSEDLLEGCEVYATKEAVKSITVARIANIYNCKIKEKPSEERAAITVKLGEDYTSLLTK